MSLNALQLTQFKVKKLQCMGGAGRAAPYRITTYRGLELGSTGVVMDTASEASNAASYDQALTEKLKNLLSILKR